MVQTTIFGLNTICINCIGDMPHIQVGGHKQKSEIFFANVDDEDFEKVSKFNWIASKYSSKHTVYAYTWTKETGKLWLHRYIMGLGDYKTDRRQINHKNGNGLDNSKSNLEVCDACYNSQSFRQPNRPTGCVTYDSRQTRVKRWRCCIIVNKEKYTQRFATKEEAEEYLQGIISFLE